jgi:ABC-type nitrate/sulfonate/bicarbonate transport system substrate-binding protein
MTRSAKERQPGFGRRNFLQSTGLAALALALGVSRDAAAQPQQLRQVRIFTGSNPSFGAVYVGVDKGFFQAEGLPVELTKFASGATAVDAFRAGRGDVVVAGDLPSLRLWQQGGVAICPEANYGDLNVIVAKKSIAKPADLRNKKLGTLMGSTSEYLAKSYLASGGVDHKEITFINLTPPGMVTGLLRGDIDAFACFQPFGWRAVDADASNHILTTTAPYFQEWLIANTTPQFAKSHPAELVALLRGLDKAGKWLQQNSDEATKMIAKNLGMDDTKTVSRMLQNIDWNIAYTGQFRSDIERLGKFFGLPIDWSKTFHPEPLARLGPSYVQN